MGCINYPDAVFPGQPFWGVAVKAWTLQTSRAGEEVLRSRADRESLTSSPTGLWDLGRAPRWLTAVQTYPPGHRGRSGCWSLEALSVASQDNPRLSSVV